MVGTEPQALVVELRCPEGARKLFAKLRVTGGVAEITSGNLIELSCANCRYTLVAKGQDVSLVLHRYNIIGDLVETAVVFRGPPAGMRGSEDIG